VTAGNDDAPAALAGPAHPQLEFMLTLRAAIIVFLMLMAAPKGSPAELAVGLGACLPAVAGLAGALALERSPRLRPFRPLAWIGVFALAVLGLLAGTLGESPDQELFAFLLLGVVIATARTLAAGMTVGAMASGAFLYVVTEHGLVDRLLDAGLVARTSVFLVAGVFGGLLTREAMQERAEAAGLRQELAALGEHLDDVLASVASGVIAVRGGRVQTYNRAAQEILGVSAAAVLERPVGDTPLAPLFEAARTRAETDAGAEATDGLSHRPDVTYTRPDGGELVIGYSLTPLRDKTGARRGTILVFQDVTLIRDYEARMLRQEQLAGLGRLVSGIAHEFGNLLGGARGHVDLALAGTPEDAAEALEIVRRTLGRALETVENLLRFARGTPVARVDDVDLADVVERALHLLKVELERGEVRLEHVVDDGVPRLSVDPAQLEQVVVNLVINALHAVRDQAEPRIRVGLTASGGQVELSVEDSGPGVPPEARERIFEPFFTTKGALGGSDVPGTGLGLAIAAGVVRSHGGTLTVDVSPSLSGARFVLALPADRSSTAGEGEAA